MFTRGRGSRQITIPVHVRYPAKQTAIAHGYGHCVTTRRDHLAQRCKPCDFIESCLQQIRVPCSKPVEQHSTGCNYLKGRLALRHIIKKIVRHRLQARVASQTLGASYSGESIMASRSHKPSALSGPAIFSTLVTTWLAITSIETRFFALRS